MGFLTEYENNEEFLEFVNQKFDKMASHSILEDQIIFAFGDRVTAVAEFKAIQEEQQIMLKAKWLPVNLQNFTFSEKCIIKKIKDCMVVGVSKRYDFWFLYDKHHEAINWEGGLDLPIDTYFRNEFSLMSDWTLWQNGYIAKLVAKLPVTKVKVEQEPLVCLGRRPNQDAQEKKNRDEE